MSTLDEMSLTIRFDDAGYPRVQTDHIKRIMREYVNNKDLSELAKAEFDNLHTLLSGECPNCKQPVFRSFEGQGESAGRVDVIQRV